MVDKVLDLLDGKIIPEKQAVEGGAQFFVLHLQMENMAEIILNDNFRHFSQN